MSDDVAVAVVGAGPYGLSCAAFLLEAGMSVRVFGEVMSYWSDMPVGMRLRSRRRSSHIAGPGGRYGIEEYERAGAEPLEEPIALERFVDYGRWFQREAVPGVDPRAVTRVDRAAGGFDLALEDGDSLRARRVVIAAGLQPFARRPQAFAGLGPELASHSSEHVSFDTFVGQRVLVVGAGQSALESAALLRESGAAVEVIARAPAFIWLPGEDGSRGLRARIVPPTDVGGRVTGWAAAAPQAFRRLPGRARSQVMRRCVRPAGAAWLRERLADVPMSAGRAVAEAMEDGDKVLLRLDDGTERRVDHVLAGTGFDVDVAGYPFLAPGLLAEVERAEGQPVLSPSLESSVAGLHFAGAPAAASLGPLMRFVVGTWYAGPALGAALTGRHGPPVRLSFRPRLAAFGGDSS